MPLLPRTGDLRLLKSIMWKGSDAAFGAIAAPVKASAFVSSLQSSCHA